jgi:hypothetical protein
MTPSGNELATFRAVAQCLNQQHNTPPHKCDALSEIGRGPTKKNSVTVSSVSLQKGLCALCLRTVGLLDIQMKLSIAKTTQFHY